MASAWRSQCVEKMLHLTEKGCGILARPCIIARGAEKRTYSSLNIEDIFKCAVRSPRRPEGTVVWTLIETFPARVQQDLFVSAPGYKVAFYRHFVDRRNFRKRRDIPNTKCAQPLVNNDGSHARDPSILRGRRARCAWNTQYIEFIDHVLVSVLRPEFAQPRQLD